MQTLEQRVSFLEETAIANLRDFFATSALSCLSRMDIHSHYDVEGVAKYCYQIADAMLIEREKHATT